MQSKRIFILGHPGAGKAVLGKAVAEKLGWQFIDADFGLEFHIGRQLTDIIGKEGEKLFHQSESEVIASLIKQENIVVTTDASIICNKKSCDLLSSELTVYLQVSTEVQLDRLMRNPAPLLLTADVKTFLANLHEQRDHLYEEYCKLSINGDDGDLDKHVSIILEKLGADTKISSEALLDKKDLIIFHKTLHTPVQLTEQQAICLKLLAQGKTSKEIARDLNISYRTVEGYIAKMTEILGCSSSKELIALYLGI